MTKPTREERIIQILEQNLHPTELKVVNQSDKHRHHAGDNGTGETHYDIFVASPKFDNLSKLNQHRMINELLAQEFSTGLHALSIIISKSL